MKFEQIDDLGIKRDCFVVTEYLYKGNKYIIYTDMANGEENEDFRLLVGEYFKNRIIRVLEEIEKSVLTDFRKERDRIMSQLKEELS